MNISGYIMINLLLNIKSFYLFIFLLEVYLTLLGDISICLICKDYIFLLQYRFLNIETMYSLLI